MRHTPFYLFVVLLFVRPAYAQTTQPEKQTDSITRLFIQAMNGIRPDSAYQFLGEDMRKQYSPEKWQKTFHAGIQPMVPFKDLQFAGTKDGMNVYHVNSTIPLLLYAHLDARGKIDGFWFDNPNKATKPAKVLSDNPLKSRLDTIVEAAVRPYMQLSGSVGLSTGIRYNGQDYFYNYGTIRLGGDTLPDNHTIYEIGSITKTFTSTLLALAVVQKKVTLDQPITEFLPDSVAANPALKGITLKQLANHTAGFPKLPSNLDWTRPEQPYEHYDQAHLFRYMKTATLVSTPGKVYAYSNLGVGLLGVILERIYGMDYAALVSKYITGPQGMKHTGIAVYGKTAQGYDGTLRAAEMWDMNSVKSAGMLRSDAADLLKYATLQLEEGKDPLHQAITLAHQPTFNDGTTKIGLAWNYVQQQDDWIWHNGMTGGFRSYLVADTATHNAVVVLANSSNGTEVIGQQILIYLK
ncbi:serine hydrolase [Chitinophaga sp.]|uniref:serine hydrolase n=1 Tax=Chitinophaga sp. TaxID=1869181 RepID=UPI0031CFC969